MAVQFIVIIQLVVVLAVAAVPPESDWASTPHGPIDLEAFFAENEANSQERIVGGSAVPQDARIPYQVSLQYKTHAGKQRHFCGGSIISPTHILTAAHCVNGQDAKRLSAVAGISDLNESDRGQRVQVASFEMHQDYQELVTSDIALIKLEQPLVLDGKQVDKIDVSGVEAVAGNQAVTLTGWGSVWHFGNGPFANYPTRLQRLNYRTITNDQCKRTMSQLTATEICALERFGKGACNGDSGGPLVQQRGDSLRQVGVVSYGTAFCASNSPDVYTRVSMFDEWLQSRMV